MGAISLAVIKIQHCEIPCTAKNQALISKTSDIPPVSEFKNLNFPALAQHVTPYIFSYKINLSISNHHQVIPC